nr:hypothetical protein [Tanacetum cinerariifolium]
MFDEYFNPLPSVTSLILTIVASDPADSTGSPSSTSVDQDAPSLRTSQTPQETHSPIIPSNQAPLSPDYVPKPEYPEYLALYDAEAPIEDQPRPVDASPTTLSLGYVTDFDPEEDPKEDSKEDPADYSADGGDDDDESFGDDANDEDEEEPSEEDEDDEEEEKHLALAESYAIPAVDPVPSAEDTSAFETDESAPTPPSPKPRRARISVKLELTEIWLRAASPPTHHPSKIPSPPLLLPSTSHRDGLPETDMSLWKRACFTAPTSRFEVRESLAAAAR